MNDLALLDVKSDDRVGTSATAPHPGHLCSV